MTYTLVINAVTHCAMLPWLKKRKIHRFITYFKAACTNIRVFHTTLKSKDIKFGRPVDNSFNLFNS